MEMGALVLDYLSLVINVLEVLPQLLILEVHYEVMARELGLKHEMIKT